MRIALKYCGDHPEITKIDFFSDGSSALTNTTRSNAHPSQSISLLSIKAAESFLKEESHKIILRRVPGCSNLEINERADLLARRGCRENHELLASSLSHHSERLSKLVVHKCKRLIRGTKKASLRRRGSCLPPGPSHPTDDRTRPTLPDMPALDLTDPPINLNDSPLFLMISHPNPQNPSKKRTTLT
jgi:hypothetical protein